MNLFYDSELIANPVFSQGEVQQLRHLLQHNISELESLASEAKEEARVLKKYNFDSSLVNEEWKMHFKIRAKIKKLAALQTKMKSYDQLF